MNRAVDYDFQDDDDLRYVHFKSPFVCPLGSGMLCCFTLLLVGLYARAQR